MYNDNMSSFEQYYYKNIGYTVRDYRIQKGLTQEQLSELLGCNLKYIGHIERCERKISNKMLIKFMDYFNIQPQNFFRFKEIYTWDKH